MPQLFIDIYADVFIAKYRVACCVWNSIFCIVIFVGRFGIIGYFVK